jgi:hypothetical protein
MRSTHATPSAIRTLLVAIVGIGCAVSAASCAPSPRVGLHNLGWADTSRPVQISATRSVAVAFTPSRDGQIDAVNLVVSRYQGQAVGLLAYLVTPEDPSTGGPAKPVAAAAGTEPACWGSVTDAALSAMPTMPQQLTIEGNGCPVQAGHTYWIQLATVLGAADLYPRQGTVVGTMLSRPAPGASWERAVVTGGLEISPVTHPVAR